MTIPVRCQRAVQSIINAVGELLDAPFYCLAYDQDSPLADSALGWAFRAADNPAIEDVLRKHGLWRGNGRSIMLNVHRMRKSVSSAAALERLCNAIAIHEVAHHLPKTGIVDIPEPEDGKVDQRLIAANTAKMHREIEALSSPDIPPWSGHGAEFIRVCCHLFYRSQQLGIPSCPHSIAAGSQYGLSPFLDYCKAIGDEPQRLENESFGLICKMPFPAWFEDLFGRDVENYNKWNLQIAEWRENNNVDPERN